MQLVKGAPRYYRYTKYYLEGSFSFHIAWGNVTLRKYPNSYLCNFEQYYDKWLACVISENGQFVNKHCITTSNFGTYISIGNNVPRTCVIFELSL